MTKIKNTFQLTYYVMTEVEMEPQMKLCQKHDSNSKQFLILRKYKIAAQNLQLISSITFSSFILVIGTPASSLYVNLSTK